MSGIFATCLLEAEKKVCVRRGVFWCKTAYKTELESLRDYLQNAYILAGQMILNNKKKNVVLVQNRVCLK